MEIILLDISNMDMQPKDIIQRRLDELRRNPFEAAKDVGLERSFINDILIEKKKSVTARFFGKLAEALDWSEDDVRNAFQGIPPAPHPSPSSATTDVDGKISETLSREALLAAIEGSLSQITNVDSSLLKKAAETILALAEKMPSRIRDRDMTGIIRTEAASVVEELLRRDTK